MLGADGVNLALMVADSGIIDTAVNDLMGRSQVLLMADNGLIKNSVQRHLSKWQRNIKKRITNVSTTESVQQELACYQEVVHWQESEFYERIDDIVSALDDESCFKQEAERLIEKNDQQPTPLFPQYFCEQWYQSLTEAIKQTQESELAESKEKVLRELYQRMETMKQMDKISQSGDAAAMGRLWDMAGARLSRGDITSMKRYSEFLLQHDKLREIADQLGRMANDAPDPSLNPSRSPTLQLVEEQVIDGPDDIVGVYEADDLNKLLPSEALLLTQPELEVVFYKHLVDKRLLNYQTQGKRRKRMPIQDKAPDNKQAQKEKGPFIVCIDASGSMSGFPEQCAKAMAYALMQIALAEDRDCYVIIFSTSQITYELTKQDGLKEAADFLSYRFHGGTDIEPVLMTSIDLMGTEQYKNADMVMISDFIAPAQPKAVLKKVAALKERNNRFHAINLSKYGNPALMSMFDFSWSYHPNMMDRMLKRVVNG